MADNDWLSNYPLASTQPTQPEAPPSNAPDWLKSYPTVGGAENTVPISAPGAENTGKPRVAQSVWDAIDAAYQSSATGLMARGKLPDIVQNPNAGFVQRTAAGLAGMASDLPESAAGFAGGAAAGSAVEPGLGTLIGAGAGAFAVPAALRSALVKAYSEPGGPKSWSDILDIAKAGLSAGAEQGLVGAAVGAAGGVAGIGAKALGLEGASAFAADKAAQVAALGAIPSLAQGHLPSMSDFEDAAAGVFGLHLAGKIGGRMADMWAKTGLSLPQLQDLAKTDPAVRDTIEKGGDVPAPLKRLTNEEQVQAAVPELTAGLRNDATLKFLQEPLGFEANADPNAPKSPIDIEQVDNPDALQMLENRIGDVFDSQIQEQRRGTVHDEQAFQEGVKNVIDMAGADTIDENGHFPGREPGEPVTLGKLVARALIARSSALNLMDKARAWQAASKNGTVTEQQTFDLYRAVEMAAMHRAYFKGASAEVGRMLRIHQKIDTFADRVDGMRKAVEGYGNDPAKLAAALNNLSDGRGALAFAEKMMAGHPLNEAWRAGMLAGPHTFMVKAIGDAVNTITTPIERGIGALFGLFHGGDRVRMTEPLNMVTAYFRAGRDALKVGGRAFMNPEDEPGAFEHRSAYTGWTKNIIGFPFRVMNGETEFFRTLNERAELHAQVARQVAKEGFSYGTNEYNSRYATLLETPTAKMQAAAKQAGDDGTYTAALGKYGKLAQQFGQTGVGRWVLPFVKVPANLVKWAVRRMPGIAFALQDVRNDFAEGGAARDMAMARQVMGGSVAYTFHHLYNQGLVTGGFQFLTPDERRAKLANGEQPYSIKIGDTWYSYERIDPIARVAALATDFADMQKYLSDPNEKISGLAVLSGLLGHAFVSQTYMSGISEVLNAIQEPATAGKTFDRFLGSFVPGGLAQIANATDPNKRRIDDWMDEIKSRIPGVRETLMPQVNPLTGEPIENNASFTPVTHQRAGVDPVTEEADRLGIGIAPSPQALHLGRGTGKAGEVQITPEQQNLFATKEGQMAHEILTPIVTGPDWAETPDIVKTKIFHHAVETARKSAAITALPADEREAALAKISAEIEAEYATGE